MRLKVTGTSLYCGTVSSVEPPSLKVYLVQVGRLGGIYHIHRLSMGEFLLPSCLRKSGLFVAIVALRPLFVFGAYLAGLFEDPTFSVGMGGWHFWGAMNLALASEYAVQTGWTRICIFGRSFPLTGL